MAIIGTLTGKRLTFLPSAFRDSHELQQLTASFTRGLTPQSTALERARRIAAGLQSRCRYALREPAGHQPDTLHRFLFGNREGYCMHFATALAVMLRLQHIPCRIAVGFYGGQGVRGDPEGMRRVFGAHHAHAWVEIPLALAPVPGSSRHSWTGPWDSSTGHWTTRIPWASWASWPCWQSSGPPSRSCGNEGTSGPNPATRSLPVTVTGPDNC